MSAVQHRQLRVSGCDLPVDTSRTPRLILPRRAPQAFRYEVAGFLIGYWQERYPKLKHWNPVATGDVNSYVDALLKKTKVDPANATVDDIFTLARSGRIETRGRPPANPLVNGVAEWFLQGATEFILSQDGSGRDFLKGYRSEGLRGLARTYGLLFSDIDPKQADSLQLEIQIRQTSEAVAGQILKEFQLVSGAHVSEVLYLRTLHAIDPRRVIFLRGHLQGAAQRLQRGGQQLAAEALGNNVTSIINRLLHKREYHYAFDAETALTGAKSLFVQLEQVIDDAEAVGNTRRADQLRKNRSNIISHALGLGYLTNIERAIAAAAKDGFIETTDPRIPV